MKPLPYLFIIAVLYANTAAAAESSDDEVLAKRGKGVVTQQSFSARADKIPARIRRATLRSGNRFREVLNTLLLRAQLAEDARAAGFDKQEIIRERVRLAAEAELGEAWLQYYVEMQPAADYEALAQEYYQLNRDGMLSPAQIDVSHILISTKERAYPEAKEIADAVRQQLDSNPALFDELVGQYSEDPSASSNLGKFKGVSKGDMVKEFEEAAFALAEGEISAPVKTQYGYHIIRLDAHIPVKKPEYSEVREQLVEAERKRHETRLQTDYINSLTSLDTLITKEALEEMARRQFGEDHVDSPGTGTESE